MISAGRFIESGGYLDETRQMDLSRGGIDSGASKRNM